MPNAAPTSPREPDTQRPGWTVRDMRGPREHVHAILRELSEVMLVTGNRGKDISSAHARPMAIAKLCDDCTLWFLTDLDTPKVDEAMRTNAGIVTGQTEDRFVSIKGSFEVTQDATKINEVWSAEAESWVPRGKDDPYLGILVFKPIEAEIWDRGGAMHERVRFG
jgi:general stress protein 26